MIEQIIDAALERKKPSLVLKNGKVLNVFTGALIAADIAVEGEKIVGIGSYAGEKEIDLAGRIALPGLIDAHVHIESSQLSPEGFAGLVMPRGTTTVIADPHEIVNVCGIAGAQYIADAAKNTPLEVKLMLPSCVPATPFETSGAVLTGADTEKYIRSDLFFGLGEFMNYPGVLNGDKEALQKICAARAAGKAADGHAPGVRGKQLCAYIAAGIATDHECGSAAEAEERAELGMYVLLREGSAAKNAAENCRAVTPYNLRRFLFCTDDRHAADLDKEGHLDNALRVAVQAGMDPIQAVIAATLNAAEAYRLQGKGAIAPGYDADIAVFDDLHAFRCAMTFKKGKCVAKEGKALFDTACRPLPGAVKHTVRLQKLSPDDFRLPLQSGKANVICMQPGTIVTGRAVRSVQRDRGDVLLQGGPLLKLAVAERHRGTGNIGLALAEGFGLRGGAVALTVAHDSHNVIAVGDNNEDLAAAVNFLSSSGGGLAVAAKGEVHGVPLDIAGLMSSLPAEEYVSRVNALTERAYALGIDRRFDAFMSLSFLALLVIPSLKLSDRGLFDAEKFAFCPVEADK